MLVIERVKQIMKENHMNPAAVAREVGIDPKLFNSMLHGRKLVRCEMIPKLCDTLKVTPNDLFY